MAKSKLDRSVCKVSALSPFLLAVVVSFISVAQAFFLAIEEYWTARTLIVIVLAAVTLALLMRWFRTKSSQLLVSGFILYCAQLGLFIFKLSFENPSASHRLFELALFLFHFGILLALFLSWFRILPLSKAFLLSFSIALGILICESVLEYRSLPVMYRDYPVYVGASVANPTLGRVFSPNSVLVTWYPDNPRGYFKEEDFRERRCWLRTGEGSKADVVFPLDRPDVIRIAIQKLQTQDPYDIQLNFPNFEVESKQSYRIGFRARADRPRSIYIGFARSHDPWTGLGLYREIELTEQWRTFQTDFIADSNDANARIHFDLGQKSVPVEVSVVRLQNRSNSQVIEQRLPPPRYFVSYRFNAFGCRGRDYPMPVLLDTKRIIVLGDSYALGIGVKEEDTLSSKLEQLLNKEEAGGGSENKYEVINCGVHGYDTRDERLFYELFASKYHPDLVLVLMVWNDDMSYLEEIKKKYADRTPAKMELLFYTWGKIQNYRYRHPFPDFSKCPGEILKLNRELLQQGSRLVVAIFRNDPDYAGLTIRGKIWNSLTQTVTRGLRESNIPIIDLGKALYANHSNEDLLVHPIIDDHPNEIAHGIAAKEIFQFLKSQKPLVAKIPKLPGAEQ